MKVPGTFVQNAAAVKVDTVVRCAQLVTCAPGDRPRRGPAMGDVGLLRDAVLAVTDGRVAWAGAAADAPSMQAGRELQASCVVPGLVDAHTHPAYAGSRVDEFEMRARGVPYLEIMERGGGILSTVLATRAASEQTIAERTERVFRRMLAHGTTTVEAKSGYGLDEETELRDLRAIKAAAARVPLDVAPTFLGAHAVPAEYRERRADFITALVERMIPRVASEKLAEFCDVFCEEGAFTLEESRAILEAARAHGLQLKIHAEEFAYLGGARMAAELGAASADHLLSLPSQDFAALAATDTVAVLLPGTTLFLGKSTYAPARGLIDAGVAVAVATDFNAGSCMTESMPTALSLAVLEMKLTPEEAMVAGTVNGAHALRRGHVCGSLEVGKRADFLLLDVDDYREWLYHFGVNLVSQVWVKGQPC